MAAEFALERIYVKDISFESPRSPQVFREPWQPNVQLDINTKATSLGDDRFEVVLTVTVNVRSQDQLTNAIVEVQQAGMFRLKGVPDEQRSRMLATYCPSVLFPYVRETVDALAVLAAASAASSSRWRAKNAIVAAFAPNCSCNAPTIKSQVPALIAASSASVSGRRSSSRFA